MHSFANSREQHDDPVLSQLSIDERAQLMVILDRTCALSMGPTAAGAAAVGTFADWQHLFALAAEGRAAGQAAILARADDRSAEPAAAAATPPAAPAADDHTLGAELSPVAVVDAPAPAAVGLAAGSGMPSAAATDGTGLAVSPFHRFADLTAADPFGARPNLSGGLHTRSSVSAKAKQPKEFDGSRREQAPEFLTTLGLYLDLERIPEAHRGLWAMQFLSGAALTWHLERNARLHSEGLFPEPWADFTAAFLVEYRSDAKRRRARAEYDNLQQTGTLQSLTCTASCCARWTPSPRASRSGISYAA